jgi:hypothetical protein
VDVSRSRGMIDNNRQRLIADSGQRYKLIAICAVLAAALVWLGINLISVLRPEPPGRPPDSPGWKIAYELNAALVENPEFAGVAFSVKSEDPLRFELVGGVSCEEVLDELKEVVSRLRPQGDYDIAVVPWDEISNTEPAPTDGEPTDHG